MKRNARLEMTQEMREAIWSHLLREPADAEDPEEAAFGFAEVFSGDGSVSFRLRDWSAVQPHEFEYRSSYHIELCDSVRPRIIKRAHDLGLSLIEFHSHPFQGSAEFSSSDILGFGEFVPHVWWRLKGRPYAAIVVAPTGFDGLAWLEGPESAVPLAEAIVGQERIAATGRTISRRKQWYERSKI